MKFAPASHVKAAQVKSAGEEEDVIPIQSKSGPKSKKTFKRTHEEEQEEKENLAEVAPAVKGNSKAGASYKPKPRPSLHHLLLVVRSLHAVPVHFLLVIVEKGALARICVVFVMSFVRVVVRMVLDLFVERCNRVVV